jgi:acyl-CoA reductase-like NAD-dependent aldehyde dehydrogenase
VLLLQLFINNKWVDPQKGGKLDVVDPRTGDTIKQIANAGRPNSAS